MGRSEFTQMFLSIFILCLFTSCVTVDKSFYHFEPSFMCLLNGGILMTLPKAHVSGKDFEWTSVFKVV